MILKRGRSALLFCKEPQMILDPRLQLAYDLYDRCRVAADIGTDHAYLPIALLRGGKCGRMILTDISPGALQNARTHIREASLGDRAVLLEGDGLGVLPEKCEMISLLGMGGKTIRQILLRDSCFLQGASLLLSAHTDLPLVRRAVMEIGYHLESEEPCRAAGRFYLILRARPGAEALTDPELRRGKRLSESASPALRPWYRRQAEVLRAKIKGLERADETEAALLQARQDLAYYEEMAD